jgi:hypothetical protein
MGKSGYPSIVRRLIPLHDVDGTFKGSEVVSYAKGHGWQIEDSLNISSVDFNFWTQPKSMFPFAYNDKFQSELNFIFPRWTTSDSKLFRFKTGWVTNEPGTGRVVEKNGYVLINSKGTELCV